MVNIANGLGVPVYTGDDSAIVYSQYNSSANTKFSLVRQPVASDGITKLGSPSTLLSDADYAVIYRRGIFVSSNALPAVSITSPTDGQVFTNPASITIQASASDPGGSISRVEFYQGSTKLGQDTAAPYSLSWLSPSVGSHSLTARAIDNLGGVKDSAHVQIYVQPPPDTTKPTVNITSPTGSRSYIITSSNINLGGTAGDNVGVTQVTWSNNRGGNGTASGTTTWAVTGIALQFGTNVITVTAHDAANNTGQAALTVAYNIPERVVIVTSGPSFGFNGGRFGFIPTGPVGQLVVVEASTDLVSWLPLWTNTFSGALNFRDPQSDVYSNRFYRAHTP